MAVTKVFHPYRKWVVQQILFSTAMGFVAAEAFWRMYAVPKVERRNFVMSKIEEERALKRQALGQAEAESELVLPSHGSSADLLGGASQ